MEKPTACAVTCAHQPRARKREERQMARGESLTQLHRKGCTLSCFLLGANPIAHPLTISPSSSSSCTCSMVHVCVCVCVCIL